MRDRYPGRALFDLYDQGGTCNTHHGGQGGQWSPVRRGAKAVSFACEIRDVVEGGNLATLAFSRRLPIHHAHAQAALAARVCVGRGGV